MAAPIGNKNASGKHGIVRYNKYDKPGIYKIQSKLFPELFYIGSTKSLYKRFGVHKRELKRGVHHNLKLQEHARIYGIDDFRFIILKYCNINELDRLEQEYILTLYPSFNCQIVSGRKNSINCKCDKQWGKTLYNEKEVLQLCDRNNFPEILIPLNI